MSEELIMIDICNWRSRRCDISLGKEARLCVRFESCLLQPGRPRTGSAVVCCGREIEIDCMGKKAIRFISCLRG